MAARPGIRDFAGCRFSSLQYAGDGKWDRLLVERFGPLSFAMALVVDEAREEAGGDGTRLRLVLRHWRVFGLPMPLWLGPRFSRPAKLLKAAVSPSRSPSPTP